MLWLGSDVNQSCPRSSREHAPLALSLCFAACRLPLLISVIAPHHTATGVFVPRSTLALFPVCIDLARTNMRAIDLRQTNVKGIIGHRRIAKFHGERSSAKRILTRRSSVPRIAGPKHRRAIRGGIRRTMRRRPVLQKGASAIAIQLFSH